MRDDLPSLTVCTFMDYEQNRVSYLSGASGVNPVWATRRTRHQMAVRRARRDAGRRAFYTLPNGTAVTLEQLVLMLPLRALFEHGTEEFSITDIRFNCYFTYGIELSWKQVRDALYRVNHGKVLFRHVGQGVYTWRMN